VNPALWFLVAAILAALGFVVAGAVALLRGGKSLVVRASAMHRVDVDPQRFVRAIARIQDDLVAVTGLLVRARRAVQAIDAGVRAMLRAFSQE
jgi:hypothetical protein